MGQKTSKASSNTSSPKDEGPHTNDEDLAWAQHLLLKVRAMVAADATLEKAEMSPSCAFLDVPSKRGHFKLRLLLKKKGGIILSAVRTKKYPAMPAISLIPSPGVKVKNRTHPLLLGGNAPTSANLPCSFLLNLRARDHVATSWKKGGYSHSPLLLSTLSAVTNEIEFETLDMCSAVRYGAMGELQNFLFLKHEINAPSDLVVKGDGMSPIHIAASIGSVDALQLLLCSAQIPNLRRVGGTPPRTPLALALTGGHTDAALLLLRAGANLGQTTEALSLSSEALLSSASFDTESGAADPRLRLLRVMLVLSRRRSSFPGEIVDRYQRELAHLYFYVTEAEYADRLAEYCTNHLEPICSYFASGEGDDDDDDDDDDSCFYLLKRIGIKSADTIFPAVRTLLERQRAFCKRLRNELDASSGLPDFGSVVYEYRDMIELYKKTHLATNLRAGAARRCQVWAQEKEGYELDPYRDLPALVLSFPRRQPSYRTVLVELLRCTPSDHPQRRSVDQAFFWVDCITTDIRSTLETLPPPEEVSGVELERSRNMVATACRRAERRMTLAKQVDEAMGGNDGNIDDDGVTSSSVEGSSGDERTTRRAAADTNDPLSGGHMASSSIAAVLEDDPHIWRDKARRNVRDVVRLIPKDTIEPDDREMWKLASTRFAEPPYSNGHDARYEAVKAELRARWGHEKINTRNKTRLKALAINKGVVMTGEEEEEEEKEEEEEEEVIEIEKKVNVGDVSSELAVASPESADNIAAKRWSLARTLETVAKSNDGRSTGINCGDGVLEDAILLPSVSILALAVRGPCVERIGKKVSNNEPSPLMLRVSVDAGKSATTENNVGSSFHASNRGSANLVNGSNLSLCGVWARTLSSGPKSSSDASDADAGPLHVAFSMQAIWTLKGHYHSMQLRIDLERRVTGANRILNAIAIGGESKLVGRTALPLGLFAGNGRTYDGWHTLREEKSSRAIGEIFLCVRLDNTGVGFAIDRLLDSCATATPTAAHASGIAVLSQERRKEVVQRLDEGDVLAWRFETSKQESKRNPCVAFEILANGRRLLSPAVESSAFAAISSRSVDVPQMASVGALRAARDDVEISLIWKAPSRANVASARSLSPRISGRSPLRKSRQRKQTNKRGGGTIDSDRLRFVVSKASHDGWDRVVRSVRRSFLAQRPFVGCSSVSLTSLFQSMIQSRALSSYVAVGAYRFRKSRIGGRVEPCIAYKGPIFPVSVARSVVGRRRGRYSWHFKVIDVGEGGVAVGISGALVPLDRPLGTGRRSYGYHSSGMKRHNGVAGVYGCAYGNGTHIVVTLDLEASQGGEMSFVVNGKRMNRAFVNIDRNGPAFYPAIELSAGADVYVIGDVFQTERTIRWRQEQRKRAQKKELALLKAELKQASKSADSARSFVRALRRFGTTLEYLPMDRRNGVTWQQVKKDLCRERLILCGKPIVAHLANQGGLAELERLLTASIGENYWQDVGSSASMMRPLRLRGSSLWSVTIRAHRKLREGCGVGEFVRYTDLFDAVRSKFGRRADADEEESARVAYDVALMWQLCSLVDWTLQAACRTESGGDSYMRVFHLFDDLNVIVTPSHTAKNSETEIKIFDQRIVVRTYNVYDVVHDSRPPEARRSTLSCLSETGDDGSCATASKSIARLQFVTMVEEELSLSHEALARSLKGATTATGSSSSTGEKTTTPDSSGRSIALAFESDRSLRISVAEVNVSVAAVETKSTTTKGASSSALVSDIRFDNPATLSSSSNRIAASNSGISSAQVAVNVASSSASTHSPPSPVSSASSLLPPVTSPKALLLRSPLSLLGHRRRPHVLSLERGVKVYADRSATVAHLPKCLVRNSSEGLPPVLLLRLPSREGGIAKTLSFRVLRRSTVFVLYPSVGATGGGGGGGGGEMRQSNSTKKKHKGKTEVAQSLPLWLVSGFHRVNGVVALDLGDSKPSIYLEVWRSDVPYPALSQVVLEGVAGTAHSSIRRDSRESYIVCVREIPLQFQSTQSARSSFGLSVLQRSVSPGGRFD